MLLLWLCFSFFYYESPCLAFHDARRSTSWSVPSHVFPSFSWSLRRPLQATHSQEEMATKGKIQYWTIVEKEQLQSMRREGLSWGEISAELGRSPSACSQKFASLLKESYWSPVMHAKLLDLVVYHGENWTKIEQELLKLTGHFACADSRRRCAM